MPDETHHPEDDPALAEIAKNHNAETGEEAAATDEGVAAHEEEEHAEEVPAEVANGEETPDRNHV